MNKTVLLTLSLLVIAISNSWSQLEPHWEGHMTCTGEMQVYKMVIGSSDTVYATGAFVGTADFDPSGSNADLTASSRDAFIQKLDPFGNLVWALKIGDNGNDIAHSIAVDNSGNIIVVGKFQNTVDFDPGPGVMNSTASLSSHDAFVLKLDPNGNYLWHAKFGSVGAETANDVKVDALGNIFVTGNFQGTVDFDPSASFYNLPSNGADDVFMVKLTAAGILDWAYSIGASGFEHGSAVTIDSGNNAIFTGNFEEDLDLDPSGVTNIATVIGQKDVFLVKIANDGTVIQTASFGGLDSEESYDITTDAADDIYVVGYFENTCDFDPSGNASNMVSNGQKDGYLVKLTSTFGFVWSRKFGGTGDDFVSAVSPDLVENRTYIAGTFSGTADLDPGSGDSNTPTFGLKDWFFEKLDANGNMKWLALFPGDQVDEAGDIYRDSQGLIRISGTFQNAIDLNVTNGVNFVSAVNGDDDYALLTLEQCFDKDTTFVVSSCDSYTLPSGFTVNSTGTYNDTISTLDGCDSIMTIEVQLTGYPTVNAGGDLSICDGDTVTFMATGADTYSWPNGITDGIGFVPPPGINSYVVIGEFTNGCSSTDTVLVEVSTGPNVITSLLEFYCEGDSVHLTASGASAYSWEGGLSNSAQYSLLPIGDDTVKLTAYDSFGCDTTVEIMVVLDDFSAVSAGPDQFGCEGDQVTLTGAGGVSYSWDGPQISAVNNQSITVTINELDYYYLTVNTLNGCQYGDTVLVGIDSTADCGIEVFNAFSPNNDGVNDFFGIEGVDDYPISGLTVYNRWGDAVFASSDYDHNENPWDGRSRSGKALPAGTYYYILELEDGRKIADWVQLVK